MRAQSPRRQLVFFATPAHACSYLPGREATTLFTDPGYPMDVRLYTLLSEHGFRRSGRHIYRPRCARCSACVPVRVPVAAFHPRRSQRRTWRANGDLEVIPRPAELREEHFALYRRYLAARHPGGGMDGASRAEYLEFLRSPWGETRFYEFRLGGTLVAVAAADVLLNALSAVYTFFDPAFAARSPGTYAILWEIEAARRAGLEWLYLGYWIGASRKMSYKGEYLPQEHFADGRWLRVDGPPRPPG